MVKMKGGRTRLGEGEQKEKAVKTKQRYLSLPGISETNGTINFQEGENCWTEWGGGGGIYVAGVGQPAWANRPVKEMFRIDDIANNLATRNAVLFETVIVKFSIISAKWFNNSSSYVI